MGFDVRRWLYTGVIIGLVILLSTNCSLADESGKIRYRQYMDFERLSAAYEYQKKDYPDNRLTRAPKSYSYRYYPACSVYYDTNRKLYYYLQDGCWKIFSYLPHYFHRQMAYSVKLNMVTDKPYIYFANHIRQFPPINSGKKNLWSEAIYVLFYKHSPEKNRSFAEM